MVKTTLKRNVGIYEKLGELNYFIPNPLPPIDPPINLNGNLATLYGATMLRIGQLKEMAQRLPDPTRFIKAYVIKEALLSSAIEGIHTTLIDVFTPAIPEIKPNKETQLVLNYTQSLNVALELIQQRKLPLASRVILAAHEALMQGEGSNASPGHYRKQAVRVGNLVPPPANQVPRLMGELETYINEDTSLPPLIKAGLAHVQFEIIHPFLDGNGRIGRLLIVLILIENGLLNVPILYPSYYFKKHHLEYYQRLDAVRTEGDFEGWINYYLKAIEGSAYDAYRRARDIELLEVEIKKNIMSGKRFLRKREHAVEALTVLFQYPITGIAELAERLGKSYNAVNSLVQNFVGMGLLEETTEQKRNKLYHFKPYLALLEKEYPEEEK